jgi:hypothetical protein
MNVTELLVTGFDGDDPVFAITLAAGDATAVLTATAEDGETAVDAVAQRGTDVFALVRELLEGLTDVPVQAVGGFTATDN